MRQAYKVLPVYTGDVSGVCSALFELGGMVVIHDPSGCNSTYNTHDEIRWYDQDSLIFISGLTDTDAIMGNDEKLVDDVVEAVGETHPRFVALVNSPIPYQLGTDFEAIARLVEARTGVPCFHVPTNGMHDYVRGAGLAFEALAERLPLCGKDARNGGMRPRRKANVLGMTPLDFAAPSSREALVAWLAGEGFELVSCWAVGDTLDSLARAGEAEVDLVVSATGLRAARVLERRCGIPWVAGVPVEGFADVLASTLRAALADGRSRIAYLGAPCEPGKGSTDDAGTVVAIGEPIVMGSIAASERLAGRAAHVVCPVEESACLVGPGDVTTHGEEEVEAALRGAATVIGDPFYQEVCPPDTRFVRLPHLALSGRQWLREIPNPMGWKPSPGERPSIPAEERKRHGTE